MNSLLVIMIVVFNMACRVTCAHAVSAQAMSLEDFFTTLYTSAADVAASDVTYENMMHRFGVIAPYANETVADYLSRLQRNADGIALSFSDVVASTTIVINQPGDYYLSFDASAYDILITTSNVSLDLKKYSVGTIVADNGNLTDPFGVYNVQISNGMVVGRGSLNGITVARGSRNIVLKDLNVRDVNGIGVLIDGASGFGATAEVYLSNIEVSGTTQSGIQLKNIQRFVVDNCRVYACRSSLNDTSGALYVNLCTDGVLKNCIARVNTGNGICLDTSSKVNLRNCISVGNTRNGIVLTASTFVDVLDSIITSNSSIGVFLNGTSNQMIKNCIIRFNSSHGINGTSTSCEIVGNVISYNSGRGIYTTTSGLSWNIIDNVLSNNSVVNIDMSQPSAGVISGNHTFTFNGGDTGPSSGANYNYTSENIPRVVVSRSALTTTLQPATVTQPTRWLNVSSIS